MNVLRKCFVFLELLVQLISVTPYTVVLKQVKPLYPSVKVYRYEMRHAKLLPETNTQHVYSKPYLGQRIYPVTLKPGNYKTRVPVKKEKGKYYKVSSTTEKAALRDPRLLALSQHLVPPISNQLEEYSEAKEEEEEVKEEENDVRPLLATPPPFGKSFPSFGQEKGRIHSKPGGWATPVQESDSENATKAEFTPSQLYLQIRHKNTVIHVPQSEALKDAETLEELINAPRLKELSRTTHVQETYSEEGYEDAGYDHAGQIRQAQHGEVYDAKDEGRFNIKEPPVILDYDSDLEESKKVVLPNIKTEDETFNNKIEPRITRSRSELSKTSVEYAKTPKNYKGEHKYSSRVKSPVKHMQEGGSKLNLTEMNEFQNVQATFPSYFGEMTSNPESTLTNYSLMPYGFSDKISSKYRKKDFNSTKIYPIAQLKPTNYPPPAKEYTDFQPYMALIDSQASPSAKSLKYSRIYSKKTKQLRLEPYGNDNIYSPPPPPPPPPLQGHSESPPPVDLQVTDENGKTEEETINQRIVLPTIGYINSLTTAHFGKESSKPLEDESTSQLTNPLNLVEALTYLRANRNQKTAEATTSTTDTDIGTFEPMKLKKARPHSRGFINKTKRDVYLIGMRERSDKKTEVYEGDDESDLPHDEKNEEIAEDERKRIEEENEEKDQYEEDLREEISKQEKEIIQETFKNIGVEKDDSEVFPEFPYSDSDSDFSSLPPETTPTPVNYSKYPFYKSKNLPENSPLRYATDPKQFPKKSGFKMEFYESRERMIQCPDFHPDLDDLPHSNSTEYSDKQSGENQRLTRVGDKIACLRMKYFDSEPFDNPIFKEKEIDYVGKPSHNKPQFRNKITVKPETLNREKKLQQATRQKFNTVKSKDQRAKKKPNVDQPFESRKTEQTTIFPNDMTESSKQLHFNQLKPSTSKYIIPEKSEIVLADDIENKFPPHATSTLHSATRTQNPNTPIGWKTAYRLKTPVRPKLSEPKSQIVKPYNCLPGISKLAFLDGTKNLTIDCNDVTLVQEISNNVARLRVIPKEKKSVRKKQVEKIQRHPSPDQSDWIPVVGYTIGKATDRSSLSRRTDEVKKLKNESTNNTSTTHYVIDELKEDENVRKGEVVEDMDHYMKLMENETETTTVKTDIKTENSTRKRREAQNPEQVPEKPKKQNSVSTEPGLSEPDQTLGKTNTTYKLFQQKRPLTRLSGLDFLVRYHKNKGKLSNQKTEDFWKITSAAPPGTEKDIHKPQRKSVESEAFTRSNKKSNDKSEGTNPTAEKTLRKYEIRETSDFRKSQTAEKQNKTNPESRKIIPLNLIPEKVTKKPEIKQFEFWKTTTTKQGTTAKPQNFTKIITRVSKETSESSENAKTVNKKAILHSGEISTTENSAPNTSSEKLDPSKYKTISRNSNLSKINESEPRSRSTESPEGPVLYYVVNLKTGRGKWITNYDEYRAGRSGKFRKPEKLKENSASKRGEKRKKSKY